MKKLIISVLFCLCALVLAGACLAENTAVPIAELPGDVNADGVVDGRDTIRLMNYLAEETDPETGEQFVIHENNADVNGDAEVNEVDLLRLVRYLGGEDVELLRGQMTAFYEFTADRKDVYIGENTSVLFTVRSKTTSPVWLYGKDISDPVGRMHDDGLDGDAAAGDGIYTLRTDVSAGHAMIRGFYASDSDRSSDVIGINVYEDPFTNMERAEDILETIGDACNRMTGEISDREQIAKQLIEDGYILGYTTNESAIFMTSVYNIIFASVKETPGKAAGGNDRMMVYTLQPFYSSYSKLEKPYAGYPNLIAKNLHNTFSNYSIPAISRFTDSGVMPFVISQAKPNSIILWAGHGTYYESYGPVIKTGMQLNMQEFKSNPNLLSDYRERGIIVVDNYLSITSKFIDKYCGDLSNSLIYIGACQSGRSSKLADALLKKGAAAVVADTNEIYIIYDYLMMKATMDHMCEINPDTGRYFTLLEAQQKAFDEYGMDDDEWYNRFGKEIFASNNKHYHAKPKIFGGQKAENFRLVDDTIKVGIITMNPGESGYFAANNRDIKNTFTEANGYNAGFVFTSDADEQMAAADDFIADGVKYLLINPASLYDWKPVLERAKSAGVRVLFFEDTVYAPFDLFDAAVIHNYYREGEMAIAWLKSLKLEKYDVTHIRTSPGSPEQMGYSGALYEIWEDDDWELPFQLVGEHGWEPGEIRECIIDAVNSGIANPLYAINFNVLYSEADWMTREAVEAFDTLGIPYGTVPGGKIIVSFGGSKHALQEVLAGRWNYVSMQNPFYADLLSEMVMTLEAGGTIENLEEGKECYIPIISFDTTTITQADVDKYGLAD